MVKKTKKRKFSKSLVKTDKKFIYLGVGGVVLLVALVVLAVGIRTNFSTGASVFVKYYGVSNEPMESQEGKIQTYVKLTQPTLGDLRTDTGNLEVATAAQLEVATDIVEAANFRKGIVEIYQKSAPVPVFTAALDNVITAGNEVANNFKADPFCLRRIGNNYGHSGDIIFVLVSELVYNLCEGNNNQYYAYARHAFYQHPGGEFLCSQNSDKLFTMERESGLTSPNLADC